MEYKSSYAEATTFFIIGLLCNTADLEKSESVEEGGRLSLAAEESVLSKGGHPSGRK